MKTVGVHYQVVASVQSNKYASKMRQNFNSFCFFLSANYSVICKSI